MTPTRTTTPPHSEVTQGLPTPERHWAVVALLAAIVVSVLDNSIINVALPTIAAGLEVTPAVAVRITNVYNLTVLTTLLPLAALGERIGARRMLNIGIWTFLAGAVACALADSVHTLMAARVLMGLACAAMMSMMGGLMRHVYPPDRLGRGIGLNAMVVGSSMALGPTLSSLVLSVADWRWLFLVPVPLAVLALVCGRRLPNPRRHAGRMDWFGAAHSAAAFSCIVLGLESLASAPGRGLALLLAGAVLALLMIRRSASQTAPLVPVDLFRIPAFSYATVASLCTFGAQMGAFVALPFYLQLDFGRDQISIGFLMTAWPIAGGLLAPVAGRLADRHSAALLSGIGACAMTVGLLMLAALPTDASDLWLIVGLALAGIGFGFFQTPNNRAMLTAVPLARAAAAGGMQATTRTFGQGLGIALVALTLALGGANGALGAVIVSALFGALAVIVNAVRVRAETRPC